MFNLNLQNNIKDTNMSSNSVCIIQTDDSDFYTKKIISESDLILNKKLLITEIEGNQLNGEKIIINCGGMLNGKRNKRDGIALFGVSANDSNDIDKLINTNNSNDFVFNLKTSNGNNNHLFFIYFSTEKKRYYIRLFHNANSFNTYNYYPSLSLFLIKINSNYAIKETEYFMIGDLFFCIKPDYTKISVSKFKTKTSSIETEKEFIYNSEANSFTIGRSSECDFSFPYDKSFSKVHCTLMYNKKDMQWNIFDGNLTKKSTNGIWLVPKRSFEVYDGMNFKILGCTKCEVRIKD